MPMFNPEGIVVIPLKEKHQERVYALIQSLSAVALQGGGKVPIQRIIELAQWQAKPVGARIKKSRGDLVLNCRRGQLQGTFMNTGRALREAIDKVPMMKPVILIGRRIDGFFHIEKSRLTLSRIRGISLHNTIGDNAFDFTYKVKKIIITPQNVTVA